MILSHFLSSFIRTGALTVIDADNRSHHYGDHSGPEVTVRLHRRSVEWKIIVHPSLALGEAYMNGELTFINGSIRDLMALVSRNLAGRSFSGLQKWQMRLDKMLRIWRQYNPVERARENVRHHYDLCDDLYASFLDQDMQYSCAYFTRSNQSLDEAQYQKKRHIAAKLDIKPGMRVLDIGCGWGGMAIFLAREMGASVVGITLSEAQYAKARQRVKQYGLEKQVTIHLGDYRQQAGSFDRIVSVGMFEHVGIRHYPEFFAKIKSLLTADGVALVHAIGRKDGPGATDPWIRKYIFPGGYVPALSEVLPVVEKTGLWTTDIEILRLHYAWTLAEWQARFARHRKQIAALYDERFCRMWEYYLVSSEMSFLYLDNMVFQLQLTRSQQALPLTRDYMVDNERSNRGQLLRIYRMI